MTLTPKQYEVIEAIQSHRRSHGVSPTLRELSDKLGISHVNIHEKINNLIKKGVIRRDSHKSRAIEVLPGVVESDHDNKLPILCSIGDGTIERSDGAIDLDKIFASARGTYALRVKGSGFAGDNICDGDYIVIIRQGYRPGLRVVALLITSEVVIGHYFRDGDSSRLETGSKIITDPFRVLGVIRGVIRIGGVQ